MNFFIFQLLHPGSSTFFFFAFISSKSTYGLQGLGLQGFKVNKVQVLGFLGF